MSPIDYAQMAQASAESFDAWALMAYEALIRLDDDQLEAILTAHAAATMDGLEKWISHGIRPGSFLEALLENRLFEALTRADHRNFMLIPFWVKWLEVAVPHNAWGSAEIVRAWAYEKKQERLKAQSNGKPDEEN